MKVYNFFGAEILDNPVEDSPLFKIPKEREEEMKEEIKRAFSKISDDQTSSSFDTLYLYARIAKNATEFAYCMFMAGAADFWINLNNGNIILEEDE